MAELLDPNVAQYGTVGGLEEGTVVRGRSEIKQMYEREADAWDRQRIEPERLIDAGDRVVVFQREYQRGRSSGLELVVETAAVIDLGNGRVVRIQGYMDRAAALKRSACRRKRHTQARRPLRRLPASADTCLAPIAIATRDSAIERRAARRLPVVRRGRPRLDRRIACCQVQALVQRSCSRVLREQIHHDR